MDDNCGEWVESMGVATGCGCKKVYRFPHTTYPYSSCICSFLQQHPYFFFFFFNVFVLLEEAGGNFKSGPVLIINFFLLLGLGLLRSILLLTESVLLVGDDSTLFQGV